MTNTVEPLVFGQPTNGSAFQNSPVDTAEDPIDIRGLVSNLWHGKWIILVSLAIAYVLGTVSISQIVPSYRATATVMFDIEQSNIIRSLLNEEGFDRGKIEDQMLILSSTNLIERVVDQLKLGEDPEFNPALREDPPSILERVTTYITLPPEIEDMLVDMGAIDPAAQQSDVAESRQDEQDERFRVAIVRNVLNGLQLSPVGDSNVLSISFASTDRATSAEVANAIANQYIVDQLEAKLEATQAATSWLSVRVDELRDDVEAAENKVEATRSALAEEQGQSLSITEQQLAALNAMLVRAQSDTTRTLSDYNRLRSALENPDGLDRISEFRASSIISQIKRQETDLAAEVLILSASVSQNNPALSLAQRKLVEVRKQIREQILLEAETIVAATQNDLIAAQEREASLAAQVRELEQKAFNQAAGEVTLRQLEREAQASRVLYENFLARLQEADVQEDLQSADVRILSPAEIPLFAESQQQRRTMLLTIIVGGVIGVGVVFLLNFVNNTFRSPIQLEDLTGESVLGTLPSIGSRMKRGSVLENLRNKPGSSLAESVRNLRTSILLSNVDNPPQVVMFTSSVPREGKTTSAMLMAMTSNQMGKSAIIVDCDLRKPAIASMLTDAGERPGLLSVINGSVEVEEAIYVEPTSGVHVLTIPTSERRGSINAADVLSSRNFEKLVESLSKTYDRVILDAPPVLVVSDARILSRMVDAVVYAVRWDKTPRGAVLEGLKEMRMVGAPVAGVVMTLVNEARATKYTIDGYNYYKGRYRDYYIS